MLWAGLAWGHGSEGLEQRYAGGVDFSQFLASVQRYAETWRSNARRAEVPEDVLDTLDGLTQDWRLLVITEDDCPDSANTVPFLARLADQVPGLELRVVLKQNAQDLLDARPTYRGYGAIPTVIVLDRQGNEAGCWIEQPAAQRAFQSSVLDTELTPRQRKKALKRYLDWYEKDAGTSTLREVAGLLIEVEQGGRGCEVPLVASAPAD